MIGILHSYEKLFNYTLTQETRTRLFYPLTLLEIKRHLRIDNDFEDDDDYLMGLAETATVMAENYIDKPISKTQVDLRVDDFNGDWIRVNEGNFISIIDISTGTIKQTSKHDDFFQIDFTDYIEVDPLKLSYYAGYLEDQTPAIIKQAILIQIATLYDSGRSDFNWGGMQNNKVFENILNYYKNVRF